MERITFRTKDGVALLHPSLNEKYTADELIDVLLDKLAAYEDTGLCPETIIQYKKFEEEAKVQ